MFPRTLETDALILTQFCETQVDLFDLYDLFTEERDGTADVFEYVPQEPYSSVKDAYDQLIEAEGSWEEAESAQYAVHTGNNVLVGHTGLVFEWERRIARIGFTLGKQYWGRGYAGECATALTDLAFERLDLDVVALDYADGNERSKRAIEKFIETVGGQYDGILRNWASIGDEIADHHRYTITQEQYRQTRSGE